MTLTRIKADGFHPLKKNVFVTDLDSGPHQTAGGILLPDDNMTNRGVHPRWARVWCVGPEITEVAPGDWVYIEHARWTTAIQFDLPDGVVRAWRIDWPDAVMLAASSDPSENQTVDLPGVSYPQSKHANIRSKAPAIHRIR